MSLKGSRRLGKLRCPFLLSLQFEQVFFLLPPLLFVGIQRVPQVLRI